jgi:hypothetical protein
MGRHYLVPLQPVRTLFFIMAENKRSFISYLDWGSTFDELDDAEAGQLIKHLFDYVRDKNPVSPSKLITIAFEHIKQDLKRDLKKWENYIEKQRVNGEKGGRPKITQKTQAFLPKPKKADNVNVNVNENTGPPEVINSNLFRKPNIPTKQQVLEAIINAGGTKDMAKSFYEKHESTGWFLNGSPVVNYVTLAQRFVTNWKNNDEKKTGPELPTVKLKTL